MKLSLLSATFVVATTIAHPQPLDARGQNIIGLFDVYFASLCATTGVAAQVKEYQLHNSTCMNTPPSSDDATFFSYRAGLQGGVPPGDTCYFDIYQDLGCEGNFMGFVSSDSNNRTCQEVLGTTNTGANIGGKSAAVYCYTS